MLPFLKPADQPLRILACVRPMMDGGLDGPVRLSALEGAMQMADVYPGVEISALALDEPGGEDVLRTCLALAADRAYLVQGPAISELDMVAIGYLMAGAVRAIEAADKPFDAIFCGDADPGQDGLGPALAGWLDYPQITGACSAELGGQDFRVWRNWDGELTCLRVKTPCVVSFLRPGSQARYPRLPRLMAANSAELPVIKMQTAPFLHEVLPFRLQPKAKQVLDGTDECAVNTLVELLEREHIL